MTMIRLSNTPLARVLHQPLYQRMVDFCKEYTPEAVGDSIVQDWLTRLYNDDPSIHILINLEGNNITEHAVIEVQYVLNGKMRIVVCHQNKHDNPSLANLDEGVEYMNKLAQENNAMCQMFFVTKHAKVLKERYGFQVARICMVKYEHETSEEED